MATQQAFKKLIGQLNVLSKTDKVERSVFSQMASVTSNRIFNEGKNADNQEIGTYSQGYQRTRARKNYEPSRKVILRATEQMFQDWSLVVSGKNYGLGFKNSANADKSYWVEDTYSQDIFKHTQEEENLLIELFDQEVKKVLQ